MGLHNNGQFRGRDILIHQVSSIRFPSPPHHFGQLEASVAQWPQDEAGGGIQMKRFREQPVFVRDEACPGLIDFPAYTQTHTLVSL